MQPARRYGPAAAMVITKKIIVPAGQKEEELELTVEAEANQYIPFALDEVNLDFQILGPLASNPEEAEVLIAASRKEKVEDRVAIAEAAGLKPEVMDVESYVTQSAFELITPTLLANGRDQNIALVDIGAHVTHLYVLRNNQFLFSRDQASGGNQLTHDIQRAFNLSPEEAESAKKNQGLPENYDTDVLQPFMETLALRSPARCNFFTSTSYNQDQIVLAGGRVAGADELRSGAPRRDGHCQPFANMGTSDQVRPRQLAQDAPLLLIAAVRAEVSNDPPQPAPHREQKQGAQAPVHFAGDRLSLPRSPSSEPSISS
jgi:type IV pilus assembly protein PilM